MSKANRRTLPDFKAKGDFTVKDASAYPLSMINAHILLHELPIFGDEEGNCWYEPWPAGRWERGLTAEWLGGMCDVARASTHAFLGAVALPLACARRNGASVQTFVPAVDGAELLKDDQLDDQLSAVKVTALAAIQAIHGRTKDLYDCDETVAERVAESMSDFSWRLAVNLAKSDASIKAVKARIDSTPL